MATMVSGYNGYSGYDNLPLLLEPRLSCTRTLRSIRAHSLVPALPARHGVTTSGDKP